MLTDHLRHIIPSPLTRGWGSIGRE